MPAIPAAPVLFSTTNCWPKERDRYSPSKRAVTSVEPPATTGTMMRTGLAGHSSAKLGVAAAAKSSMTTLNLTIGMVPPGHGRAPQSNIMSREKSRPLLQIAEAVVRPALAHARLVFGGWTHSGRKAPRAPRRTARFLPRARGVDQHPVPEAGAELGHVAILHRRAGIDGRAENSREDDHAALPGVDAMRKRPLDLLVVGGVDVLLHHDHVLVAVLRGAVAPERRGDLLGLALVVLLDLDADVDAVGDGRRADVEDAGDAGAVENVPGDAGALHRGHHAVLAVGAGQGALERAAEKRVRRVRNAGDLHGRTRRRQVGHVARELAERPFALIGRGIVADGALDDDLRRSRHLEVDRLAAHQLRRLAAVGTHHVPFAQPGGQRRS